MAPMRFRLHPAAEVEATEAAAYIKADDPLQGEFFAAALEEAISLACKQPLTYRRFDRDHRKVRVGKFRYAVVFRMAGDEIQVLAVMHLHRRPGYWKGRARDCPA